MSIPIRIEPISMEFIDLGAEFNTENQAEREKINEIIEVLNYLLQKENMIPFSELKLRG